MHTIDYVGTAPLPFRRSAIPDREAKKIYIRVQYSVVTVSASYRPSSKVVGCGKGSGEGAVEPSPQVKNIFIYRFSSKG